MQVSRGNFTLIVVVVALLTALATFGAMSWLVPAPAAPAASMQAIEPINVSGEIDVYIHMPTAEITAPPPPATPTHTPAWSTNTPTPTQTPRPATATATATPADEPVGTNSYVNFYGVTSQLGGAFMPAGSVVRAYDPTGRLVGKFTVHTAGQYGVLPVYGDDPVTAVQDGAKVGDPITFTIDRQPALTIGPDAAIWTSHGDLRRVELVAGGVLATPTATSPPTATPVPDKPAKWAPFLDQLGVQLMRRPEAQYELVEAWAIVNGSWEANQELGFPGVPQWAWDEWVHYNLGGDTHVYGIVLDRAGNPRTDVPFVHWWGPGGSDGAEFHAEPNGWCNSKLGSSGQPQGQYAPRHWFPQGGEKLTNIWLPYNRHVTVFGVWRARW